MFRSNCRSLNIKIIYHQNIDEIISLLLQIHLAQRSIIFKTASHASSDTTHYTSQGLKTTLILPLQFTMPNIDRSEIANTQGTWSQRTASNPGNCRCGNYYFYSSLAECTHCVQVYSLKCGKGLRSGIRTGFCGPTGPVVHVVTHRINEVCAQCQARNSGQGQPA